MARIRTPDLEWNVEIRGEGRPLLLVHGFPLDHSMWSAQLDDLSRDHRVIAPDLRGFGGTEVTAGTVRMEQFADDLAALLVALGISEPIVYCGLSMGGYIGWQFERRHGDRLAALVQCDTRAAADSREAAETRLKTADEILASGPDTLIQNMVPRLFHEVTRKSHSPIIAQTESVIRRTSREGLVAALRGMAMRTDATDWLKEIGVPTLLLGGTGDLISPPGEMRAIAAGIPGATFVEIADAGHMAPLEQPRVVNQAIRDFISP